MSNLRSTLRTALSFSGELSDVMRHANSHMLQNLPQGMSATLFLGLFDLLKGTLEYINAGHMQPFVIQPQSTVAPLGQQDNPTLGVADASFETSVEILRQPAYLLVFTDGITKTQSPDGKEFGTKRLMYLLRTTDDHPAGGVIDLVTRAVEDFRKPCPQHDDITLFILINRQAK